MAKKIIIEAIGTFFLVIFAAIGDVYVVAAGLCALIYMGGHISGAHYNPAVSLAFFMRGKMSLKDMLFYITFQLIASTLAGTLFCVLKTVSEPNSIQVIWQAVVTEFMATFLLVFTILNVATAKGTEGNNYFGAAIALAVVAGVSITNLGGTIGALNPAVALGLSIANLSSWADIWTYFVVCFAGGAIAAITFKSLKI